MSQNSATNKTELLNSFWQHFYLDQFEAGLNIAHILASSYPTNSTDLIQNHELVAIMLIKLGDTKQAFDLLSEHAKDSALYIFTAFLISGEIDITLLNKFKNDPWSKIYKAYLIAIARVYWGASYVQDFEDPDELILEGFTEITKIDEIYRDYALLVMSKMIEIYMQHDNLSLDLYTIAATQQIDNLINLAKQNSNASTKGKLYLLKAMLTNNEEFLEDASIAFGTDKNFNGLAEVYLMKAFRFNHDIDFDQAINLFSQNNNKLALGLIYTILSTNSLVKGEFEDAKMYLNKAKSKQSNSSIFDLYTMQIQQLTVYSLAKDDVNTRNLAENLIQESIPHFFKAQAKQIYAGHLIKSQQTDDEDILEMLAEAAYHFEDLGQYFHLLQTLNIKFQFLLKELDLKDLANFRLLKEEVNHYVKIANKIKADDLKADKYLDFAYTISRAYNSSETPHAELSLQDAVSYYEQAKEIYASAGNLEAEAHACELMGNIYIDFFDYKSAVTALNQAVELYKDLGREHDQAAIKATLGYLLTRPGLAKKLSYPRAIDHLTQALEYFMKENVFNMVWRIQYVFAVLHKTALDYDPKAHDEMTLIIKTHYLQMLEILKISLSKNCEDKYFPCFLFNISIDQAVEEARKFFEYFEGQDYSDKFNFD
jgi:hypothetical protein